MSDEIHQLSNIATGNQSLLSNQSEINNESTDLAVCVEGAWKNYGSWWKSMTALHDVTLRVPTGVM
jgi:hypothetical protein